MANKKYEVKVIVEYIYEVEADSEEQAEQEGWNYEEYKWNADVYSIKTELIEEMCEECEQWESDCTCNEEEEEKEENE
jgi:hypothetical protein